MTSNYSKIIHELERFVLFRTRAALSAQQLPSLEKAKNHLQWILDSAMDEETAIRAGLYAKASTLFTTEDGERYGELYIMATGLDGKDTPAVTFRCKLKKIDTAFAVRKIQLGENHYAVNSLDDLVRVRTEERRYLSIFRVWESSPWFFRCKYPICPHCGSVAHAVSDGKTRYRMSCDICGWISENSCPHNEDVALTYVDKWYWGERAKQRKSGAGMERVKAVQSRFQSAAQELIALGQSRESLFALIDTVAGGEG